VAEVEAILGPLSAPPQGKEMSCRFDVPMDSATAQRRARYRAVVGPDAPGLKGVDYDRVSVIVSVDVRGNVADERGGRIAGNMLTSMFSSLGKNLPAVDTTQRVDEPQPPPGWDVANVPIRYRDFRGRIGHVTIQVEENVTGEQGVAAEKKARLAALVRDRIPDFPFRTVRLDDGQPIEPPAGPAPCSLLTRDEAEQVLGKLVVAPYRSHDGGPLYDEQGTSCAYYTANHRTLVLTPHWTDGKEELRMERGIGNLVAGIAGDKEGEAADTLDGPWDDVVLGLDGRLALLKGDRLLSIGFATSSTDQAGALKLARIALARLASGTGNQ
jgi:hypothetical protein